MQTKERAMILTEEMAPLSKIIEELNTAFGTDFTEEDKVCIRAIEERLSEREDLRDSMRVNPPDNARLTFDIAVGEVLQDMVETHFKFYKHVNDDQAFADKFYPGYSSAISKTPSKAKRESVAHSPYQIQQMSPKVGLHLFSCLSLTIALSMFF